MYRKILIPVDGSEPSQKALQHGIALAEKFGAEVTIFNVLQLIPAVDGFDYTDELRKKVRAQGLKLVADYKQKYQTDAIDIKTDTASGGAAYVICEKAENEKFDLVVIGSRGLSTGPRILLGSVSDRVSRHCPCPVLIVR